MDYQQYRTFRDRAAAAAAPLRLDCMNPVKALAPLAPAAPARVVPVGAADVTAAWLDLFRVPGAAGLALATSGVRPALRAVFALLARRRYEVWLPEDVYPAYWELAREQGPASKPFTTCPAVALDALAAAGPRSAALLPCPLAPAGRHLTGAEVEALRSWLAESPQRRLILDAVYLFDNRLDAAALALWGTGRAFVLHSLAKAWLAPATLGTVLAPPDAAAAVPSLIRALGRKDDDVLRARAAFALSEVGSRAATAVPELHKYLADGPASVRLNAAVALWAIEKKGAVLVPALSAVIEGKEDATLRASAAELLARVAASKKSAGDEALGKALRTQGVPALRQAAADADEGVRVAATLSLGGLGVAAERALPDLMRALDDHVADVRVAALEALAKIGQAEAAANPKRVQARVAYPKLMNSARLDANDPVRLAANQTMTRVGRPGAADMGMLIAVLKDGSWPLEFRTSAAQSLALVEAENDVKQPVGDMVEILRTDSHAGIRMFVAYALADLGPKGVPAVAALGEALKEDKDAGVRRAAATALGDIGPYARAQAEPVLERALTDADEGVQQAAREALKKVRAAK